MKIELCGEQTTKPVVERRGQDEYGRSPAQMFYIPCQLEVGHEGMHVGQWFGRQIHWQVK